MSSISSSYILWRSNHKTSYYPSYHTSLSISAHEAGNQPRDRHVSASLHMPSRSSRTRCHLPLPNTLARCCGRERRARMRREVERYRTTGFLVQWRGGTAYGLLISTRSSFG